MNTDTAKEQFWWGEATDEPAVARQSVAATAREDARPTERANQPAARLFVSWTNSFIRVYPCSSVVKTS